MKFLKLQMRSGLIPSDLLDTNGLNGKRMFKKPKRPSGAIRTREKHVNTDFLLQLNIQA